MPHVYLLGKFSSPFLLTLIGNFFFYLQLDVFNFCRQYFQLGLSTVSVKKFSYLVRVNTKQFIVYVGVRIRRMRDYNCHKNLPL